MRCMAECGYVTHACCALQSSNSKLKSETNELYVTYSERLSAIQKEADAAKVRFMSSCFISNI